MAPRCAVCRVEIDEPGVCPDCEKEPDRKPPMRRFRRSNPAFKQKKRRTKKGQ